MAYLDGKRLFVAGATGMAGHALLRLLAEQHQSTKIRACLHRTEPRSASRDVEYLRGDLRVQDDCRRMVRGCDCAIMAAATGGGAAVLKSEPWRQVNDNALMVEHFLEACCVEGVKRLVYVDSATLYQEFSGPIREDQLDMNTDPPTAYMGIGWVTRFAEKLCQFWHVSSGLQILIGRTTSIFGPYASFDPVRSNFIPAIIRKAVDRMDPFEVWGHPGVARDVLYVDDLARAILAMMNKTDIEFDVFNVGSGLPSTVGEVVELALQCASYKPGQVLFSQDKPTTIGYRALDCSKAKHILGWEPECSLVRGIEETTAWWKANREWWTK